MVEIDKYYYKSPIGVLELTGTDAGLTSLFFVNEGVASGTEIAACLQETVIQLDEYFTSNRREFALNLQPEGTPFQKQVWQALTKIPFGQTVSYKDIAVAVGDVKAVRAVGAANGRNPLSIIVPCHRVIGSTGKLTGYGGELWRKEWLLKHEGYYLL